VDAVVPSRLPDHRRHGRQRLRAVRRNNPAGGAGGRDKITISSADFTLAGGTTDRASERKVQIIRTGDDGARQTIEVDLRKVKRGKAEDPVLQKDDLVLVPESFF